MCDAIVETNASGSSFDGEEPVTSHIALLRGINVGGHKKVALPDLRRFLEEWGFADVRSLLQTANLVFRGGVRTGAGLQRLLELQAENVWIFVLPSSFAPPRSGGR